MSKPTPILAVAFLLAAASGCSDGDQDAVSGSSPARQAGGEAAAPETGGPKISVSADKTHAVQPEDEITVSVSVEGFELDETRIGQDNAPGVGHYRIYLDEARGDDFLAASAAPSSKVTVPSSITDGSHELRVVLYNNDRTPLKPGVEGSVLLIVYRL